MTLRTTTILTAALIAGLVVGCTRSRFEQTGEYHKAYDEYLEQVRDNPGDRMAREGLKRTAPFAVAYWQKQASVASQRGDWIKATLCHATVLEIQPDTLSSVLSMREISRNHPREYASAMRQRVKLDSINQAPTLTQGTAEAKPAATKPLTRPTPADEDVTARTARRSTTSDGSAVENMPKNPAPSAGPRSELQSSNVGDGVADSSVATAGHASRKEIASIEGDVPADAVHTVRPSDVTAENVRMVSAETATPVQADAASNAEGAVEGSTATLADAGEKNITLDFAEDQEADSDDADATTTSAPADTIDSDADVTESSPTTATAPAKSKTPAKVTGRIHVAATSRPATKTPATTAVASSATVSSARSTTSAPSQTTDAAASDSAQQPLRAIDDAPAADSTPAPLTERGATIARAPNGSMLDAAGTRSMSEPKRRYKIVPGDPYKQKTVVLYPGDATKGEFTFIAQVSRKDKRFQKQQSLLDNLSVKVEDCDDDPLDCDFEVKLGKKKVIDLKGIREGAVLPVIGESHRMFELVVIHIKPDSKTVTFGLRSVEE